LLNSGNILFQGKIADSAKEGAWIFSIWMFIDEDKRTTSQFTITEVTKNKEKFDEPRGNQTNGEGGNNYQQGQTAGVNTQVPQQTVHLFPVPEL
jgi:hypothetical protein